MKKEIEAGELKENERRIKTQKTLSKGHFQHIRRKSVPVKNGPHLMNKGNIQCINLKENRFFWSPKEDTLKNIRWFYVGELSVPR